jgi:hypothetical protein
MQIVLSRPYDDETFCEVYIVEHRDVAPDMLATVFERDWDTAKTAVIKKEPETWILSQVIELMEKKIGWQILQVSNPVTVTY